MNIKTGIITKKNSSNRLPIGPESPQHWKEKIDYSQPAPKVPRLPVKRLHSIDLQGTETLTYFNGYKPTAICPRKEHCGHFGAIYAMIVTRDGKWIVTSGQDKTIKVWDFETTDVVRTMEGHTERVNHLCIGRDGV